MMENSTCTSFAYLDSDAVIIDLVPILEAWEEEKTFLTCCPGGINSGVWFVRHNNIGMMNFMMFFVDFYQQCYCYSSSCLQDEI